MTGSVASSSETAEGFTADQAFHDWYATRTTVTDRLDLAIIDRSTGLLVGEVVLHERDVESGSCNLRVLVGAVGRGRGLGAEAVALVTVSGLDVLGLQRISLEVFVFNPRARRVYEKVGFVHETTLPAVFFFDGAPIDAHVMTISRRSPHARPRSTEAP